MQARYPYYRACPRRLRREVKAKIEALPAEGFRYYRDKWLSCSGDSQVIAETVMQSVKLLEKRPKFKWPRYFSKMPRKCYVARW